MSVPGIGVLSVLAYVSTVEDPGRLTRSRSVGAHAAYEAAEVIQRRGPWRSLEAVEFATLEWDWFNNRRLLEPIGTIPPAEAEANYYAAPDNTSRAA